MKKIFLILIPLIVSVQLSTAQEKLNENKKLASTAKIWGFLKYYHPHVGSGKFNWDDELIQIIPKVEQATTKEELSLVYIDWLNHLGKVKTIKNKKQEDTSKLFTKNFDLSWLENKQLFTPELSEKLKFIENNRLKKNNHYAGKNMLGTLKIKNEPEYINFDYPNENYRLLSLFKYWNIIEYFFPYKYQTDQKWDDVLVEMIPKFKNAKDTIDYHLAMLEVVTKIDDSHGYFVSKYISQHFGPKFIPVATKIINNKAIVTRFYNDSLARINDLRIGDVITKINGENIETVLSSIYKYIPASNIGVKNRNSQHLLYRGKTDEIKLTIERDGSIIEKDVKRYTPQEFGKINNPTLPKWKIIDNNIGYVNMGILNTNDVSSMMDSLMSCKSIIFDIRNYPNGTMYKISRYLNNSKKSFAKFTKPDFSYLGKYKWTGDYYCGNKNKNNYKGKIILLVNETTQSHAEFTCMSLQTAENVTVIGSQTSGADGNINPFEFIGGFKTNMTGLGVFYPDKRETQRIGIVPDITIHPTIEGIRQGKDEVLEKAIEFINK